MSELLNRFHIDIKPTTDASPPEPTTDTLYIPVSERRYAGFVDDWNRHMNPGGDDPFDGYSALLLPISNSPILGLTEYRETREQGMHLIMKGEYPDQTWTLWSVIEHTNENEETAAIVYVFRCAEQNIYRSIAQIKTDLLFDANSSTIHIMRERNIDIDYSFLNVDNPFAQRLLSDFKAWQASHCDAPPQRQSPSIGEILTVPVRIEAMPDNERTPQAVTANDALVLRVPPSIYYTITRHCPTDPLSAVTWHPALFPCVDIVCGNTFPNTVACRAMNAMAPEGAPWTRVVGYVPYTSRPSHQSAGWAFRLFYSESTGKYQMTLHCDPSVTRCITDEQIDELRLDTDIDDTYAFLGGDNPFLRHIRESFLEWQAAVPTDVSDAGQPQFPANLFDDAINFLEDAQTFVIQVPDNCRIGVTDQQLMTALQQFTKAYLEQRGAL